MIVADTDVLIEFLRGRRPWADRIELELEHGLATTAVSVFELRAGVRGKRELHAVDALLLALRVLPLGAAEAHNAAEVRRELERVGYGIGMGDSLIAGICREHRATLLTANRKHFERVSGLALTIAAAK